MIALFLLAALADAGASASAPQPAERPVELAQLMFRSRVVVRVQTTTVTAPVAADLREKKGPPCIGVGDILAAGVLARSSVDLILRGGYRVRARFAASCPGLNYYTGFYLVPSADGKLCADRDLVRDRAGGECEIDKFRRLVAAH